MPAGPDCTPAAETWLPALPDCPRILDLFQVVPNVCLAIFLIGPLSNQLALTTEPFSDSPSNWISGPIPLSFFARTAKDFFGFLRSNDSAAVLKSCLWGFLSAFSDQRIFTAEFCR
jgi:hypothetical protein